MPIKTKIADAKEAAQLLTLEGFWKWIEGKDLEADDVKPEILELLKKIDPAKVRF